MPNYTYKCCVSKKIYIINLPISFDPNELIPCICCKGTYTMRRTIGLVSQFPEKVGKVFAADWFKKTYGYELGGKAISRADFQKDLKKVEELAKKDGVNINHEHIKKLEGD